MTQILVIFWWYVLLSAAGWLVFPLAYRMLPALADRGYSLSKAMGLLVWGYLFWLSGSLGLVPNNIGGILLALLGLVSLSIWIFLPRSIQRGGTNHQDKARTGFYDSWQDLLDWVKSNRALLIRTEVLFAGAFGLWVVVRAANPGIFGTEKPMEVAFINAILKSETLPPHDPWLAGYSISYYYFGYLLVAMLARLSGIAGHIAFNLGVATVFALSATGAYGVVFNLLARRTLDQAGTEEARLTRPANQAFFAPVLILLVSNIEGLLEVLHARGLLPSGFWRWLDIVDINQAPQPPDSWLPRLFGTGGWWWWRASRVLQDFDLAGNPREIIDEFPLFSFLLADLHPHVLAIPFAFLAVGLALQMYFNPSPGKLELKLSSRTRAWLGVGCIVTGAANVLTSFRPLNPAGMLLGVILLLGGALFFLYLPAAARRKGVRILWSSGENDDPLSLSLAISPVYFWLAALSIGGLAFLNTWDFPFYVAIFAGAYALRESQAWNNQPMLRMGKNFLGCGLALGIAGVILYLPFYLSFSSQVGGIIPNLIFVTRGVHLWVMFATLLIPLFGYLFVLVARFRKRISILRGFAVGVGLAAGLWLLSLLLGWAAVQIPGIRDLYLSVLGANPSSPLFQAAVERRMTHAGGWLTLVFLLGLSVSVLWLSPGKDETSSDREINIPAGDGFVLLLVLIAGLLVLGPEFFYLRDQFGWRINTIFKFYYQAWLLWGLAAAYGIVVIWSKRGPAGILTRILVLLVILAGSVYSVLSVFDKTHGFLPPSGLTLDGMNYLNPEETTAILWLYEQPLGTLVEAVGGSYSGYARVAAFSGQPGLLGWPGHESQWRGGSEEMGSRQSDIQRIYCSREWDETQAVLDSYDVRYIYVGELERIAYTPETCGGSGLFEEKFLRFLNPIYRSTSVTIYEVPQ